MSILSTEANEGIKAVKIPKFGERILLFKNMPTQDFPTCQIVLDAFTTNLFKVSILCILKNGIYQAPFLTEWEMRKIWPQRWRISIRELQNDGIETYKLYNQTLKPIGEKYDESRFKSSYLGTLNQQDWED